MSKKPTGMETRLTHAGNKPAANHGVVNPPVYHASTILWPDVASYEAPKRLLDEVRYGLHGTPTQFAFEEAVAGLMGGAACIAVPSGLAAITGALLPLLQAGDHVLVADHVYAPTRHFCDHFLARFGVETTYYDPMIGAGIKDLMRHNTRVVFTESPGSLSFEVQDIPAIAAAAHKGGALVIIDDTWSAGLYFQPFAHGVDISAQAVTKYIGGHSDLMLGAITTHDRKLAERIKLGTTAGLGFHAAPDDCYLALRGLRTLAPRLARHQETALALAHWLAGRPEVETVLHPALPTCPGHEFWKRDFTGSSGLFSFVLKEKYTRAAATAMIDATEIFGIGSSWGGYESLLIHAAPGPLRTATQWPHRGPALRLHAGLEDLDDLKADLQAGFAQLAAAG